MDKPIAVLGLSNWGGIAIFDINDYEQTVKFKWYDDEIETTHYYYNDEGEAYFLVGETQYYFNEFMRIGGY